MRDLAPNITRQRLLMEGFFQIKVDSKTIEEYFTKVTQHLNLKAYGEPIIFSPGGEGKEQNQGYDAFVPLIDSGISLYIWTGAKFFSIIIYTCKSFDEKKASTFTKEFFNAKEIEMEEF